MLVYMGARNLIFTNVGINYFNSKTGNRRKVDWIIKIKNSDKKNAPSDLRGIKLTKTNNLGITITKKEEIEFLK